MKLVTTKFKSGGGLHEKHVVATWNLGNHLSICLRTLSARFSVHLSKCLFSEIAEQKTSSLFKVAWVCVEICLREFNFGSLTAIPCLRRLVSGASRRRPVV